MRSIRPEIEFEIEDGGNASVAIVSIRTPWGVLEICAEFTEMGSTLKLSRAHIQSDLQPNSLGPARLRTLVEVVMERMDLDAIEIEGASRTTGAGPGRVPKKVRFTRQRRAATQGGGRRGESR